MIITKPKHQPRRRLVGTLLVPALVAAALAVGLTSTALAVPPAWDVPDEEGTFGRRGPEGPGTALRQSLHLHMRIGNFYMLQGDYETALDHFLAVATFEIPVEILEEHPRAAERGGPQRAGAFLMAAVAAELTGNRDEALTLAEAGQAALPDPDSDEWSHRRGRRGDRAEATGRRGRRGRAAATETGGETDGDVALETGDDDRPRGRRHGRRGHGGRGLSGPRLAQAFEQFNADPAGFAERFAGGIAALEGRLLELETGLIDNRVAPDDAAAE